MLPRLLGTHWHRYHWIQPRCLNYGRIVPHRADVPGLDRQCVSLSSTGWPIGQFRRQDTIPFGPDPLNLGHPLQLNLELAASGINRAHPPAESSGNQPDHKLREDDKADYFKGVMQRDLGIAHCLEDKARYQHVISGFGKCARLELQAVTEEITDQDNAEDRHHHVEENGDKNHQAGTRNMLSTEFFSILFNSAEKHPFGVFDYAFRYSQDATLPVARWQ